MLQAWGFEKQSHANKDPAHRFDCEMQAPVDGMMRIVRRMQQSGFSGLPSIAFPGSVQDGGIANRQKDG